MARGKYPAAALDYRMASKGLFQSDPHDARIIKAFALGLAVATRGMDHLRNRVTMEINARINDDPEFKHKLYGGEVAARPNDYSGKEYAVARCERALRAVTLSACAGSIPGCSIHPACPIALTLPANYNVLPGWIFPLKLSSRPALISTHWSGYLTIASAWAPLTILCRCAGSRRVSAMDPTAASG